MLTEGKAAPTSTRGDEVVVRAPGDGPATWAMASLFEHLATGAETGGQFCLSLVTQPPGLAPPLHVHTLEAEAFYLLEGTMTYRAGDTTYRLGAGHFIYLPRGVPHAFRITERRPRGSSASTCPAASWIFTTPSACRPANAGSPVRTAGRSRRRSRAGTR